MAQNPLSYVGKTKEEIGLRFPTITLFHPKMNCKEVKGYKNKMDRRDVHKILNNCKQFCIRIMQRVRSDARIAFFIEAC